MEYRSLGASGCAVSAIALGTMTFGNTTDRAGAFAQLDAFAEAGGTLIDTADVYVGGASETIIGRWLADRPVEVTERMVLATKGRFPTSAEPDAAGLSRRHLDRALNRSTIPTAARPSHNSPAASRAAGLRRPSRPRCRDLTEPLVQPIADCGGQHLERGPPVVGDVEHVVGLEGTRRLSPESTECRE